MKATVILFKSSGKYYTEEEWTVPDSVPKETGNGVRPTLGPYGMLHSPDFRRIGGGAVLVIEQEPWGYPHLFPGEVKTERKVWKGGLNGGPDEGRGVSSSEPSFEVRVTTWMWLKGSGELPDERTERGRYVWDDHFGVFAWVPIR